MANEPIITMVGNLVAEPELRFTPGGDAVVNFTIAQTPKTFDRQTNESKDGETIFMRCNAWREMAENISESLTRGTRVVAHGRLRSRTFDTKEGEKRTVTELEVDEVGPSLRWARANVTKGERGTGGGGGSQKPQQPRGGSGGGGGWGGQQQPSAGGWGGSGGQPQGGGGWGQQGGAPF